MLKIIHRVNDSNTLSNTPKDFGVEMDIHAFGSDLVVHHDAFVEGENFESWIRNYHHNILILNVKEEGVEFRVREIVQRNNITDYFFLDIPVPAIARFHNKTGETKISCRLSEFESFESVLKLRKYCSWVFVDLFENKLPLNKRQHDELKNIGYRTCLVSPELWGRDENSLKEIKDEILSSGIKFDAVITKKPESW